MYSSSTDNHRTQLAELSTGARVIHRFINRTHEKKRKESKTNKRGITAVYFSTKRLIFAIVSLLIIPFIGVTGTPYK
nr:MAG TPA: hypothetical protein [Caudoviricetes sp.]